METRWLVQGTAKLCALPRYKVEGDFADFDVPFGTPIAREGATLYVDHGDGSADQIEIHRVILGAPPEPHKYVRTKIVARIVAAVSPPASR